MGTLAHPAARPLALAALALAWALLAGCSSPPLRRVETRLGPDVRISFDGKGVDRDAQGNVDLPIVVTYEYFQEAKLRLEEPGKPPLVADVIVLVNPPKDVEDRLAFESKANTTVVYTGEKGGSIAGPTRPVSTYPDPLEQLVLEGGAPFGLPADGQGVVVVASDARARVKVAGGVVPLRGVRDEPGARSLPVAVDVPPGPVNVEMRRGASVTSPPFATQVVVRPGEWRLIAVHLGEDRPSLEADDPAAATGGAAKRPARPKDATAKRPPAAKRPAEDPAARITEGEAAPADAPAAPEGSGDAKVEEDPVPREGPEEPGEDPKGAPE